MIIIIMIMTMMMIMMIVIIIVINNDNNDDDDDNNNSNNDDDDDDENNTNDTNNNYDDDDENYNSNNNNIIYLYATLRQQRYPRLSMICAAESVLQADNRRDNNTLRCAPSPFRQLQRVQINTDRKASNQNSLSDITLGGGGCFCWVFFLEFLKV